MHMISSTVHSCAYTKTAVVVLVIILFKILILHLMGRPLTCACGDVRLWQGALDPTHNSQHFSDHYSWLHAVFGVGLFHLLVWMRPDWSMRDVIVAVAASSAIWEVMENTTLIIDRFAMFGSDLDYRGDSILNSAGDTLFMLAGAIAAMKLSRTSAALFAISVEASVFLLIGDGILLGTLRLVTGSPMA
ncbi:DUF2585 family protein [Aureimonas fodinaquatilis]|uniref:DUF2585 family protein n=1 Tax=Aureimonas fodinaquatilis TaxID=2565783 RepID=A0A5B0E1F9_9HYPH|nr:DUF2585 family protein [Aureimonas fodinaquatilis]KAA0971955.1 DUF2585 family protein [Aureimonas fodinaquatilis]